MKKQIVPFILLGISVFSYCHSTQQGTRWDDSLITVPDVNELHTSNKLSDTSDCNKLLNTFFQSSTFEPAVMTRDQLVPEVEYVTDSIVSIRVKYVNKESNMTLGWMRLDLRKRSLVDVTADTDVPVKLQYDKEVLKTLMERCNFQAMR